MAQINVTLTVVKEFFRSNPMWTTWEDMQINRIEFLIFETGTGSITRVNAPIPAVSSPVITANVMLNQNTAYAVRVSVWSPLNPSGISSISRTFNTADTVVYHNLTIRVTNANNNDVPVRIPNATLTLEPLGLNIVRQADEGGLMWIQRIPAGTYPIRITAPEFLQIDITWVAGTPIGPIIGMIPIGTV